MDATDTPEVMPALSGEIKVKLRKPLKLGKEEIEELTLKPTASALREFEIPVSMDGVFTFRPYPCAVAGMSMAGYPAAAKRLVDQMDPRDMMTLAQEVFGFLGG